MTDDTCMPYYKPVHFAFYFCPNNCHRLRIECQQVSNVLFLCFHDV